MNRLLKFLAASLMLAAILAGCAGIVESPEQREAREQREAAAAAEAERQHLAAYMAMSCPQLAIELSLATERLAVAERLAMFERGIEGDCPSCRGPARAEAEAAHARWDIDDIITAYRAAQCGQANE